MLSGGGDDSERGGGGTSRSRGWALALPIPRADRGGMRRGRPVSTRFDTRGAEHFLPGHASERPSGFRTGEGGREDRGGAEIPGGGTGGRGACAAPPLPLPANE